jgi:iron complex transport system substrate-binding protein
MSAATPAEAPARIASLLASGTELVCALGLGERLVARSHECDFPAWVKRLPAVSHPTFDVAGTSADIDARVRERLRAGLPLYEVDEALLASLAPDVIVTQTHCEVCAVSPGDLSTWAPQRVPAPPRGGSGGEAARAPTRSHGAPAKLERRQVVALDTGTIDGILTGFESVARVLGAADAGRALVAGIRARLAALAERTRALPRPWPTVACLEWTEPLFAMGNWGPELVALAGGTCALGVAGEHSTTLPWQALRAADPDVVVVAPCGFGLERTLAEMPALAAHPDWPALAAVRAGRVYVADGNLYFNRSGPLLFDTPEILAEMLHPRAFSPAHEGTVWRRYP